MSLKSNRTDNLLLVALTAWMSSPEPLNFGLNLAPSVLQHGLHCFQDIEFDSAERLMAQDQSSAAAG